MLKILLTFGDVEIKEITVKNGLQNPSENSNEVVVIFHEVSIDPIENVQS